MFYETSFLLLFGKHTEICLYKKFKLNKIYFWIIILNNHNFNNFIKILLNLLKLKFALKKILLRFNFKIIFHLFKKHWNFNEKLFWYIFLKIN